MVRKAGVPETRVNILLRKAEHKSNKHFKRYVLATIDDFFSITDKGM